MRLVLWMSVASWISWLPVAFLVSRRTSLEVLCGMFGPLVAVCATWIVAERTYRHRPEALTAVMIAGFAAKLLFFITYVTVMIRGLSLEPVPFVASFTAYFIVLYFIAALNLKRLFWGGMRS